MQLSFPSRIHDASRQESEWRSHGTLGAAYGDLDLPVPWLESAPEYQVPERNADRRDCNGERIMKNSFQMTVA
jgi:hypothetical protein